MTSTITVPNSVPQPAPEVQQRLLSLGDKLCMLPAVAAEAIELVNQPDCSVRDFSALLQRDVKLATDILALANSAAFAPVSPIASLNEAVVRLGFRQCRNLILSTSVAAMMQKLPLEHQWVRELLAQHSYTTGIVATHLNRALNVGYQGEEFAAGLVHDFGRLLLAVLAGDAFADADPMSFDEDALDLDAERAAVQTDHCEVGAWFAAHNKLPDMLVDVLRWHHAPSHEGPYRKLVALTAAADHMANYLQRTETAEGYVADGNVGIQVLADCGIPGVAEQFGEICDTLLQTALDDSLQSY